MVFLELVNFILISLILFPFGTLVAFSDDGSYVTESSVNIEKNSSSINSTNYQSDLIPNFDDTTSNERRISISPLQSDFIDFNNIVFREDTYPCQPCICWRTKGDFIVANCSSRQLYDVPMQFPAKLQHLNLSYNYLETVNFSDLEAYPNLMLLDLSFNRLTSLELHSEYNSQIQTLYLDNNHLTNISGGKFQSMLNLRKLSIKKNKLTSIDDSTFKELSSLKVLILSFNRINSISNNSFDHLIQLSILHLENNMIGYSLLNQIDLKDRLIILKTLNIQDNTNSSIDNQYPDKFLHQLTNLQELHIDVLGPNVEFGSEIKSLKHLKILKLGPRCYRKNISSTFFEHFVFLESLQFSHCLLDHIDYNSLKHLKYLKTFRLYFMNTFDLTKAFKTLAGLQEAPLTTISFVGLHHKNTICSSLYMEQGKMLTKMNIVKLDLSYNRIARIEKSFLEALPNRSLKILDLSNNRLSLLGNLWPMICKLSALEVLDVKRQNIASLYTRRYPKLYESQMGHYADLQPNPHASDIAIDDLQEDKVIYDDDIALDDDLTLDFDTQDFSFDTVNHKMAYQLPPKLHRVTASEYITFGSLLLQHGIQNHNTSLKLDFSNSFLTRWGSLQLPCSVTKINLSKNHCNILNQTFFPECSKLEHLEIQGNYLGPIFRNRNVTFFKNLKQLHFLDISLNSIFDLPEDFFEGLDNLKIIFMRDNKLRVFDMSLFHMTKLEYLDLSQNSISWISNNVRADLDRLSARNNVSLKIINNPLPCTCKGLEILEWMSRSKVHFVSKEYLKCYISGGSIQKIGPLKDRIHSLRIECTSHRDLVVASFVMTGIFIIALSCYRLRWYILYTISNRLVNKVFGFNPSDLKGMKFDAYVFYSQEDRQFIHELVNELESKRGHRLCVEDRDFIPGTVNFSNIANAVAHSTVTLIVISPDVKDHQDFDYALHMSFQEEYYNKVSCYVALIQCH